MARLEDRDRGGRQPVTSSRALPGGQRRAVPRLTWRARALTLGVGLLLAAFGDPPARLMTFDEYGRVRHVAPYVLDISAAGGRLVYVGSRHTNDPDSLDVRLIEELWRQLGPEVAFNEGGNPPAYSDRDQAVRRIGESGLVRHLAARDGVQVASLDPTTAELVAALREEFSLRQLKLFFTLLQVKHHRNNPVEPFAGMIERVFRVLGAVPGLAGPPGSVAELAAAYAEEFLGQGSFREVPDSWFDPVAEGTFINDVARRASVLRDRFMVDLLVRRTLEGKRVFAVVGASHVVMQEALIRRRLADGDRAGPESPAAEPRDEELSRSLAEYLDATAALGHFSGSVLVAREGRVLLRAGYGFASIEHRVSATPQTRYRIASISKQFAAAAVLALRAKGLLELDDPLERHLPGLPPAWRSITLRQLLRHTSGIPDYEEALGMGSEAYLDFMSRPGVPGRILEFAKARPLEFAPGSEFRYSNSAYVLVGYLIEAVSGRSFEEFLLAELLEPAGLRHTGHGDPTRLLPHRASGYTLHSDSTPVEFYAGFAPDGGLLVPAPFVCLEPPLADGGLYSTVDDLYRWERALASGGVLDAAARDEMTEPGPGGYGLGWFVGERFGRRRIWHTGVLPGFLSVLDRYPDDDATVIVLGNTDLAIERISEELAAILFGQPYAVPEAHRLVEITAEQFRPCVGTYRSDEGRLFAVSWDELPVVEEADRFAAGMFAKSPTEFFVPMFRGTATFVADDSGRIQRLVARIRGRSLTLERLEP